MPLEASDSSLTSEQYLFFTRNSHYDLTAYRIVTVSPSAPIHLMRLPFFFFIRRCRLCWIQWISGTDWVIYDKTKKNWTESRARARRRGVDKQTNIKQKHPVVKDWKCALNKQPKRFNSVMHCHNTQRIVCLGEGGGLLYDITRHVFNVWLLLESCGVESS